MKVAILGGGLAGMSAAVKLAQAGVKVTLVETSRRLGGRATSHVDPTSGQRVDNCQHVLLGCCTNLLDFYKRLGVDSMINWAGDLHFFDKLGHHDVLKSSPLAAPLHLSAAMWRFRTLSFGEKLAISRAMVAMMRLPRSRRHETESMTFEQWLKQHGQPQGAIDKFWAVVVVSALNQMPHRASAAPAIQVFQEGFLAHRDAYRMGTAAVPLGRLYDGAAKVIEDAGGEVIFGGSVKSIDGSPETGVSGVTLADGTAIVADTYISAMPFDRLEKTVDERLKAFDPRLQKLDAFRHSPILGIHLWFEKPVIEWPHMIFVDSPLQWVFVKGLVPAGGESELVGTQYLHGVISAADEWVDKTAEEILAMSVSELAAYEPRVKTTKLSRGKVVKEKRATFSPEPGVEAARPGTTGAISNLLLAGDWTSTGWPATMEGAVRSGYKAAGAVLKEAGLVEDLPVARLYKLAGAFAR
jgi:zeta-carotene desaturase